MPHHFDLAVIGAGPGGYVAAIRAAQLGFKVSCIDKRSALGGTCLNVGCIPSKALLQSTEFLFHLQTQAKEMGIKYENLTADFLQMMERKNKIIHGLEAGITGLFKRHDVSFIQGEATFIDPHSLLIKQETQEQKIEASFILIATGSAPIPLPDLPFDERQILSSTGVLSLPHIPKRLIVIGGGVIGVELASVYCRLGAQVTIIEMLDYLCAGLDQSLSQSLLKRLKNQGIECHLTSRVVTVVKEQNEVILTVDLNGTLKNLSGEVVLVAIGRSPYTHGLGLEKVGIQIDQKGFILVDRLFRTVHPHIFAFGDVISGPMLAHRASAEGMAIVNALRGEGSLIHSLAIPNVIYTYPEVASVGLSEQEARACGLELLLGTSFLKANARARCSGETDGFVKVLGEKHTGKLIGMHMIAPHASELISEGMLAIQQGITLKDIARAPQAHPTLSEAIKEAALEALGQPMEH